MKERRVNQNSQEWFDGEITNEIENHNRLFKNLKHGYCTLKKDFYNAERYKLQKMIINKKEVFLETN